MIRNMIILTGFAVGIIGIFMSDARFLLAGAAIVTMTLFMKFKSEPLPPPAPHRPREIPTPLEVLQEELQSIDEEMSNMDTSDVDTKECYLAMMEKRGKLHEALADIAKAQR